MTAVEYDEMTDAYYAECDCGWTGHSYMRSRDADMEADRHDELHDDGVI